MTWREYHDATRHSVESLRQSRHFLDWANMPDPFRHYQGVPVIDLPASPPRPDTPALEVLTGVSGATSASDGPAWLSQLLFYAAAISASKVVPSTGCRYALRVNPLAIVENASQSRTLAGSCDQRAIRPRPRAVTPRSTLRSTSKPDPWVHAQCEHKFGHIFEGYPQA